MTAKKTKPKAKPAKKPSKAPVKRAKPSLFDEMEEAREAGRHSELLVKWRDILDYKDLPPIKDKHVRYLVVRMLEHTHQALSKVEPLTLKSDAGCIAISLVRRVIPELHKAGVDVMNAAVI